MKNIIFLLPLALFLQACDAPQRIRVPVGQNENAILAPQSGNVSGGVGFTSANGTGTTTTGGSTGGTTGQSGTSITCTKTVTAFHAMLGSVDVCQDANNELSFRLSFNTADQADGTCIVPMFRDPNGLSTYLGNAQCTKHNQGQTVMGSVQKSRVGYTGLQINSVMVLKYSGTTAFFQCMNAYGTALSACMGRYGNNQFYKSYCETESTKYMENLCTSFKSTYPHSQVSTR